jgi:hypothetical protein
LPLLCRFYVGGVTEKASNRHPDLAKNLAVIPSSAFHVGPRNGGHERLAIPHTRDIIDAGRLASVGRHGGVGRVVASR